MIRILLNILIILSVFALPVYISVFFVLFSIFLMNNYVEAVFIGFLIDTLYGSGGIFGIHFAYFFTVFLFIIYAISSKLKKILRLSF